MRGATVLTMRAEPSPPLPARHHPPMKLSHPPRAIAALALAGLLTACTTAPPASAPAISAPAAAPSAAPPPPPAPPVVTAPPAARAPAVAPPGRPVRSVRDAQQRLAELGYDPGPADGVAGAQTAAALRAFQSARGLLPTGRMDSPTREALER